MSGSHQIFTSWILESWISYACSAEDSQVCTNVQKKLPRQCKAIACLTGKTKLNIKYKDRLISKKHMSDRYCLHIFVVVMRIRNPHNFIWWACCNATADYGHGGNQIPICFGVSSSQTGLLNRLNAFNTKDAVAENTTSMLLREKNYGRVIR